MSAPIPEVLPANYNAGITLLEITWATFGAATAVMIGRLISKVSVLRRFALDDAVMLLAWLCVALYTISTHMAVHYGFGRHYEYLVLRFVHKLFEWLYVSLAPGIIGPMLGRISFMLYLLAIIGKAKHVLRYTLWISIALQAIFNIALLLAIYTACGTNITTLINPAITCFRHSPWFRFCQAVGALNVASDAFLVVTPTLLVWHMRTPTRAKVVAITLLSLSSLAMLAAIWRTIELDRLFSPDWDFAYDAVPYFEASSIEQNVIIISASVPTLGPLVRHLRRNWSRAVTEMSSNSSRSRPLSGDSAEIQHNLARALGMRMPGLGNSVHITAGSPIARDSQEHILPLSALPAIRTTKRTDVKVEYMNGAGDETEPLSNMRSKRSSRF